MSSSDAAAAAGSGELAGIGATGAAAMARMVMARGANDGRCTAAARLAAGVGIDAWYDTRSCGEFIERGGHTKVALQFPDAMLPDAAAVAAAIVGHARSGAAGGDGEQPLICILGDVTFGAGARERVPHTGEGRHARLCVCVCVFGV
jgi:hypothetical protein